MPSMLALFGFPLVIPQVVYEGISSSIYSRSKCPGDSGMGLVEMRVGSREGALRGFQYD